MAPLLESFDKLIKLWEHSYHENHDSELMSLALRLQEYSESRFSVPQKIPDDLGSCQKELLTLRNKHNSAKELLDREIYCNSWLRTDREIIKNDIQSVIELLAKNDNAEACKHLAAMAIHLSKPLPKRFQQGSKNTAESSDMVTADSVGCTRDIHLTFNVESTPTERESHQTCVEEEKPTEPCSYKTEEALDPAHKDSLNLGFMGDIPPPEPPIGLSDESLILASPRKDLNFCYARDIPAPIAPPLCQERLNAMFDNTKILKYNVISSTPAQKPEILQQMNCLHNGHSFSHKYIYWTGKCQSCGKKLAIGKPAYKCSNCRSVCHFGCIFSLPLPCVSVPEWSSPKNQMNKLEDHAPSSSPMVPAVVINCTYEVERRGLKDEGIYRISCSELELKSLKEKFMKSRTIPILRNMDIYLVCCFLKEFFRSLQEPLITQTLWRKFADVSQEVMSNSSDVIQLCHLISELPQTNQDTLAWMLRHLLIVSQSPFCKMDSDNLATIFGPTLVGFSSPDPSELEIITQTGLQKVIMSALFRISQDHWQQMLKPTKLLRMKKNSGLVRRPSDIVNAQLSRLIRAGRK